MKKCSTTYLLKFFVIVLFHSIIKPICVQAQSPEHEWVKSFGSKQSSTVGTSIAIDKNRNVYTCGGYQNIVDFDPSTAFYSLDPKGSGYVSKLNEKGEFVWAKSFNYSGLDVTKIGGAYPTAMVIDNGGNIIITGRFTDSVDFDPGVGVFNLYNTASSWNMGFVCKLDSNGHFIFAKQFYGVAYPYAIACDRLGNIFTTGTLQGAADFDPSTNNYQLISNNGTSIFISKLDAQGNFEWAKIMDKGGNNLYEGGFGIDLDADGNVYTTGTFEDSTDFDPGPNVYKLYSIGPVGTHLDAFVSRLDNDGNFIWAKQFGKKNFNNFAEEASVVFANSIVIDKNSNVITSGYFGSNADFDPGSNVYDMRVQIGANSYISKIDKDGNFIWAKQFESYQSNTGGLNMPFSITTDACNNIYTMETIDMDPSSDQFLLVANSDFSVFGGYPQNGYLNKLDEKGNFLWAGKLEGEQVYPVDVSVNNENNIYTTGMFYSLTDFNPYNADTNCLISLGQDAFVHKLYQNCNIDTGIATNQFTLTANQANASYQWINCTTGNAIAGAISPSFTATENGSYAVMITLNECCHATSNCIAIKNIGVVPHGSLYVPNAFSPNGDGVNPTFIPIINGQIKTDAYKMMVFNRWGNQMFTSNDISKGWDGMQNGMPCEMGTYFYYIECQTLDNQKLTYKGDVTLIK
jgi:gliding motility-associated-like protein